MVVAALIIEAINLTSQAADHESAGHPDQALASLQDLQKLLNENIAKTEPAEPQTPPPPAEG